MARHPGIVFRALTWNLFHGRAHPPAGRPLLDEFVELLRREPWDIALLQEAPPRWFEQLCRGVGASGAIALTSRNFGSSLRGRIADWKPDLIKSNEGGSNQLLVRPPWRIADTRRLTLARFPERRRLLWARLEREGAEPLAVANLHASANRPRAAARELVRAADWCGANERLLFGGDLNLRPAEDPATFDELGSRFGLAPPTAPTAIDHLLVRGLEVIERPDWLPAERRDADPGTRLSDHGVVTGVFSMA
ncbi:MAG TPA: endonuclease/exonuclease/phosphatase family protein [Thermoleophilaceae bacterium]